MEGLEFVRCYLDDLLILSNGTYDDHLSKIDTVLQRLQQAGCLQQLMTTRYQNTR